MDFRKLPDSIYDCARSFAVSIGMEEEPLNIRLVYDSQLLELMVSAVFGSSSRVDRATYEYLLDSPDGIARKEFVGFPISNQIVALLEYISRRYLSRLSPISWVNNTIYDYISEMLDECVFIEV